MSTLIDKWKSSLGEVLEFYNANRPDLKVFYPRLFLFFVLVNVFCYWWATVTAFPQTISSWRGFFYYFKIQFPVGVLGALFDSLSFFITIFIINQALKTKSNLKFYAHLSLDLVIAIAATFWVLFVFSFSSWLIRLTENNPELSAELIERQQVYRERMEDAVQNPTRNLRNIYFGIIMGVSAMLPTVFHIYMSLRSRMKMVPKWVMDLEVRVKDWILRKFEKMNKRSSQAT